jgi:hypothetical protein
LLLTIHEIGWDCAFLDVFHSALGVLLFVLFDGLLHLDLLFEPLLVEEFGLETLEGLGLLGDGLRLTGFLLTAFLLCIQTLSEAFFMQIHIVVLRHLRGRTRLLKSIIIIALSI